MVNDNTQPKDQFCYVLAKNVAAFCLCLKSLPKAKLKSFGLILFAGEISKQPNIDSVVWLLVFPVIKGAN